MKALQRVLAVAAAVACLVALVTCRPIVYYLEQVYRVQGRVTVAGSDPPTPVGSVEIQLNDSQYSELTNYYGDYEMELPEGTGPSIS